MPLPLSPGLVLNDRYLVRHVLGQGGFGRTYLAEDNHRFNEPCVLKEFAPQLHQPDLLLKARELFEREAGILYQLQHAQIPEFRALLTVSINQEQSLFLVEQFIQGESYAQRIDRGLLLTEGEAIQFLRDLMPVLDYIHSRGVIHRDIAPDNLICDSKLGKPVLIDFGSVKQVATTAMKLLGSGPVLTQIHKLGYTPPEQFRGEVHPSSDFYSLAVTTLVLLTGRTPTDFYDEQQQSWRWRSLLTLNSGLGDILDRMLSTFPQNRYPTAATLQQALGDLSTQGLAIAPLRVNPPASPSQNQPHALSNIKTVAVAPAARPPARQTPKAALPAPLGPVRQQALQPPLQPPLPSQEENDFYDEDRRSIGPVHGIARGLGWLLLLPFRLLRWIFKMLWGGAKVVDWVMTLVFRLVLLGGLLLAFVIGGGLLGKFELPKVPAMELPKFPNFDGIFGGGDEASGKTRSCAETVARHKEFNIPSNQFYGKVNQRLYDRHPELQGRPLTADAKDEPLREEWCGLAEKMLDAHSKGKSPF
jgi:serine/threonine protein kinase